MNTDDPPPPYSDIERYPRVGFYLPSYDEVTRNKSNTTALNEATISMEQRRWGEASSGIQNNEDFKLIDYVFGFMFGCVVGKFAFYIDCDETITKAFYYGRDAGVVMQCILLLIILNVIVTRYHVNIYYIIVSYFVMFILVLLLLCNVAMYIFEKRRAKRNVQLATRL